jgi:hypothetical protein
MRLVQIWVPVIVFSSLLACASDNKGQNQCSRNEASGEYHGRYNAHYNLATEVLTTVLYFLDGKEGEGSNTVQLPSGQTPRIDNVPMHAASGRYDEEFYASGYYYIQKRRMPLASSHLIEWTRPDGGQVLNNFFFPDPYSQMSQPGGVNLADYRYQSDTHAPNGHECYGGYVLSRMDSGSSTVH